MRLIENGYTFIELLVAIVMLLAIAVVISGITTGIRSNAISHGFNGTVETRCIDGQKFVIDSANRATQIVDSNGNGIPCLVN